MADNDQNNGKIINLAARTAEQNRRAKGPTQNVIGTVSSVTDLAALSAVAFHVKHGREETLFWMSTERAGVDGDYRKPLMHETVKVWFNDSARSLDVFGEKARGIVEIQNISNDSEQEAFRWFRENEERLTREWHEREAAKKAAEDAAAEKEDGKPAPTPPKP